MPPPQRDAHSSTANTNTPRGHPQGGVLFMEAEDCRQDAAGGQDTDVDPVNRLRPRFCPAKAKEQHERERRHPLFHADELVVIVRGAAAA